MPHALTAPIVGLVFVGTLVTGTTATSPPAGTVQSRARTVYVSVSTKDGTPVTDMTAGEFEVKEGGKTQAIVSVKEATGLLRVALLVSDAGTGGFQAGIARFIQKLLGRAEFALTSVQIQAEKVTDYTADVQTLRAGINRLGIRAQLRNNAQLIEAIQEATKDVGREAERPVIVVMRVGGEAASSIAGNDVREDLRKSGAILYVISTLDAMRRPPSQIQGDDAVSVARGQLADDEVTNSVLNLAIVLGDGSKESGGRHEQVVSTTLITSMEQIADELLHQYEIRYSLPEGAKPSDKISVSSKRKGVTVHAPTRKPN
jgi:VWFA-related protein